MMKKKSVHFKIKVFFIYSEVFSLVFFEFSFELI